MNLLLQVLSYQDAHVVMCKYWNWKLIINRLLYYWLKEICSHDGILLLIPIIYLKTPLDRDKWQYKVFRVDIKDIVSKCLSTLRLLSVLTMLVAVFYLFSFSISILLYCSYVLCFWKIDYGCNIAVSTLIKQLYHKYQANICFHYFKFHVFTLPCSGEYRCYTDFLLKMYLQYYLP